MDPTIEALSIGISLLVFGIFILLLPTKFIISLIKFGNDLRGAPSVPNPIVAIKATRIGGWFCLILGIILIVAYIIWVSF